MTLSGSRHPYIVRGLELVKLLDRWCKVIWVDLQFELHVAVQRNIQCIAARTVTGEPGVYTLQAQDHMGHAGAERCSMDTEGPLSCVPGDKEEEEEQDP
jgi:hypothetical protein